MTSTRFAWLPAMGAGLLLAACSQAPAPPDDAAAPAAAEVAAAEAADAAATPPVAPPSEAPQAASPAGGKLTGSVSGLGGQVSGLRGLISALGGEERATDIYVALPADTLFAFDKAEVLPTAEANLAKLAELIGKACEKPKRRIPTKVSKNQKRKRVEAKKKRAEVKALRGKVDGV